ncbi:MAG TPA: hypothetical protein DGT21_07170 [Armatimonadetes bacterium]|nr:hypothetical protein [Armatimonadota bacterium]
MIAHEQRAKSDRPPSPPAGQQRVLGALVVTFGIVLGLMIGSGTLRSYDVWWHLRLGQDIIATDSIALHDGYSHTAPGGYRPPQQWLFEVLQAACYSIGGDASLVWIRMLFGALSLGLLAWLLVRRRTSYLVAVVALVLTASASMPYMTCRPHLAMPLFLLGLVSILQHSARRPGLLWLVPALFAWWANVHASFTVGMAVIGVWAVGEVIGKGDEPISAGIGFRAQRLPTALLVIAGSVAGSLINPVGFGLITYSLDYLPGGQFAYHAKTIQEWMPPDVTALETAATTVLLLGGMLVLLIRWRHVRLFELLLGALMVAMGLKWGRSAMHTCIVMAWLAMPVLSTWLEEVSPTLIGWRPGSRQAAAGVMGVAFAAVMLVSLLSIARPVIAKRALYTNIYPVAAADWIAAHDLPPRMFNPYHWGGYLIHRLYPRYRVFIDGRVDLYGRDVFEDWQTVRYADDGWEDVLRKYGVTWGVLASFYDTVDAVKSSKDWEIIYDDGTAVIFARKDLEWR